MACLDRPVVGAIDNGGFQYTESDLIVTVDQNILITVILYNTDCFGVIKASMLRGHGHADIGCALVNPRSQNLINPYGVPAVRVNEIEDCDDAIDRALHYCFA